MAESRPVLQSTAYVASFSFFFIFLAKSIYYPIIISCGAACWGEANRAINYHFSSETSESATLESGIDVGQGINVGPEIFDKKNKHRALNKHRAWKICQKKNERKT